MSKFTFATALACATSVIASALGGDHPGQPMITPAPILERQISDPGFVGYFRSSGYLTWDTERCTVGNAFSTSGKYGACCPTTDGCSRTDFATGCSGTVALYPSTRVSCLYACNTDYIAFSVGDSSPVTWVGCAYNSGATSVYRTFPSELASATASYPTYSYTPSSYTSTTKTVRSYVWIAGVVVGVLFLLGVIAVVVFLLLMKKRRNKRNLAAQQQPIISQPPMGAMQPMGPPGIVGAAVPVQVPQQGYFAPGQEQKYNDPNQQQPFNQPPPVYPQSPAPDFQQQQQQQQPYTPALSPQPGWVPTPSQTPAPDMPGRTLSVVSPMSSPIPPHATIVSPQTTGGTNLTSDLAAQERTYQDNKGPVGNISEIGTMAGSNAGPIPTTLPTEIGDGAPSATHAGPVPTTLPTTSQNPARPGPNAGTANISELQ
ncbi:hypothetical protein BGZ60DRAFT_523975 [Tricladium varicosporioides]|nr:hypothetical protein BGZ60DRAFT_523975 [Hymenoscyphus varicosporioides]